ncbi:imidazole glycerol phosphate synthase subunit HisH [Bifidobacterium sp. ESL0763]|uniref:imidazole glycerol phosphate synthase subunit HisH n=1 Tax=Bifidobacterium sp. ESL0763 TaxID=2983227 RepID=UPI0023F649AA|nr:imidazole glycerol phosphate synthase subunit HisH [Bifidobacterium sp. ESL0763]MDF7664170.1 imidazole glycerol phosphate synthase subunit HisH [Bifidobacterium sp. ESL0763]
MARVVVFDYGFGNVRSMMRALAHIGLDATLTADRQLAVEADGLVVPGVGAFAACMRGLRGAGGDGVILSRLAAGRPVLGVCVGLQIMFARGSENGESTPGLGVIDGSVDLIDADVVPHMGWDTVEAPDDSALLQGLGDERFYFVHSYASASAAIPGARENGNENGNAGHDETGPQTDQAAPLRGPSAIDRGFGQKVTWCDYGRSHFVAAYERGPLCATQFHPEKSGEAGSALLRNWAAML